MFDIDSHEKEILAVGYKNKTIENKDKWNQLNLIDSAPQKLQSRVLSFVPPA